MAAPASPATPPTSPLTSSRERRKRHDGSEIDPVKNLEEFLRGIPASDSDPVEEPEPAPPAVPAPVQLQVPPGPTPEQIIAEERGKREKAETELASLRSQSQITEAVRREVAQQAPPQPVQAPPPDPRLAEIQETWFTDPSRAQQLMQEMNDERMTAQIEKARGTIRQELTAEQQEAANRQQGTDAFNESRRRLLAAGVSQEDLDNHFKVTGLYTAVTLPPTADRPNPYYVAGGPRSADVLVKAWTDLYGAPTTPAQAPAVVAAPPPRPPPIVAPPGSGRPAPAAEPPKRERATAVSSADQRDITYLAEALNMKPENLINRRRARLEREKGNQ